MLGFGTFLMEGNEAQRATEHALAVGYRHVDTADAYRNHREVGQAIKNSGLNREEVFLTTKVWRDRLREADVREDTHRFLEELQTDYLDLLLIHWPNRDIPIEETLRGMATLKEEGTVRSIGVSNFTVKQLQRALQTDAPVENNQVEFHPTLRQDDLQAFCDERGIVLTAYAPLAKGEDLSIDEIQQLADKHRRTPAQIILSWLIHRGIVAIPKSRTPERIEENFGAIEFRLPQEDVDIIERIQPKTNRQVNPGFAEFDA